MENLSAAIPVLNTLPNLSAEEFQNFLSSWLEEKGIISDIRSHLRFKLINILRNTVIGKNINNKSSPQNSLSKQAINLIVGEFLMQNKCHYSLSIFNTEASLTNVFPEYPAVPNNSNNSVAYRFDAENILNIMELIGVPKSSIFCKDLLNLYFTNNENNSILSCLVTLLCKHTSRISEKIPASEYLDLSNETNLIKYIGGILIQNDYSADQLQNMIKSIKSYQDLEINALELKHGEIVTQLKKDLNLAKNKLKEVEKSKKGVEHKLIKISSNYKVLKTHVKDILKEKLLKENLIPSNSDLKDIDQVKNLEEKIMESNCKLPHCNEICKENVRIVNKLQKENLDLKEINKKQSEEIKKITVNYNNLLKNFVDCQNKISLLNSRVNEGDIKDIFSNLCSWEKSTIDNDNYDVSEDSSNSLTEQILKETKLRLRVLEEESRELEENYKSLQYGICQIKL